jgi:hypothetical protein
MRYIDADALHDSIDKETYRHTYIEQIHSIIDNAPTIDAEPVKHGTWTVTYTDDGEGGEIPHLICSECKREPLAWNSKRFFKYCPNCGAKMDGERREP